MLTSADQALRVLSDRRAEAKPTSWAKSRSVYDWTEQAVATIELEYAARDGHRR